MSRTHPNGRINGPGLDEKDEEFLHPRAPNFCNKISLKRLLDSLTNVLVSNATSTK